MFYSHISFKGVLNSSQKWYKWDSVSDWAKIANKHLISFHRDTWKNEKGELYKLKYTKDHLEIFIPNY